MAKNQKSLCQSSPPPLWYSPHHFSCLARFGFWDFLDPIFGLFAPNLGSKCSARRARSNGTLWSSVAWKMARVWHFEKIEKFLSLMMMAHHKRKKGTCMWLSDREACGLPASQPTNQISRILTTLTCFKGGGFS